MDFDPVKHKLKVNFCSAGDLKKLLGVGNKWVDKLLRLREGDCNITPQSFHKLGIRDTPYLMTLLDFEPWYPRQPWGSEPSMSGQVEMQQVYNKTQHQYLASGCDWTGPCARSSPPPETHQQQWSPPLVHAGHLLSPCARLSFPAETHQQQLRTTPVHAEHLQSNHYSQPQSRSLANWGSNPQPQQREVRQACRFDNPQPHTVLTITLYGS